MKFPFLFLQTTTSPDGSKHKNNELDLQNDRIYKVGNRIVSENIKIIKSSTFKIEKERYLV